MLNPDGEHETCISKVLHLTLNRDKLLSENFVIKHVQQYTMHAG